MTDNELRLHVKKAGKLKLNAAERTKAFGSFISLPCGFTHYEVKGEGEPCVLVHGYATPYCLYDKVFDCLVQSGYRVLRYDLLGRGLSERVKTDYTPELFAKQLSEITKAVFGCDSFYLFGTSMGSSVVTAFTAMHPERVKKLILLAPQGMDTFKAPFYMKLSAVPLLGDLIFYLIGNKTLLSRCAAEMTHVSQREKDDFMRTFAYCMRYKGFLRSTLSSLRNTILRTVKDTGYYVKAAETGVPVLCIWGTNDKTMPYYQSERFKEVMPKAELVTFEGSGHVFLFDESEKTMSEVLPFLKK